MKKFLLNVIGIIILIGMIIGILWFLNGFLSVFNSAKNSTYQDYSNESGSMPYPYNY